MKNTEKRKRKVGSIQQKLVAYFSATLLSILITICIGVALIGRNILQAESSSSITMRASYIAEIVNLELEQSKEKIEIIARNEAIIDQNTSIKKKLNIIRKEAENSNFTDIAYIELNGTSHASNGDLTDINGSPDFESAKAGVSCYSDPIFLENETIITIAVPVKDDNNNVVAVLLGVNTVQNLTQYFVDIESSFFIINKEGYFVAHVDDDVLNSNQNPLLTESEDTEIYQIYEKMVSGENGFGEFYNEFLNERQYIGYAPVETADWSVAIMIDASEITKSINRLEYFLSIVSLACGAMGVLLIIFISGRISKTVSNLTDNIYILASGDFVTPLSDYDKLKVKESVDAKEALERMRRDLGTLIGAVKDSILDIKDSSQKMEVLSGSVQNGSENISASTGEMAVGVESQTDDLVEIAQLAEAFGQEVDNIVTAMKEVGVQTCSVEKIVMDGNEDTKYLNDSVDSTKAISNELRNNMDSLSKNIEKVQEITELINSIADQTNLLALNASIEAARAGEAGKGFAVVAEEIRSLAEQVKVSSINIGELIASITREKDAMNQSTVDIGEELTSQMKKIKQTVQHYESIIANLNAMSNEMGQVNNAIAKIDDSKNVIVSRITNVTAVAEEISASTEEIAASTENNSQAAFDLKERVNSLNQNIETVIEQVEHFKI